MHHVLRLVSKSGAQVEYLYSDKATADQARDICKKARSASMAAVIFDQAGREADIDGGNLFAVQLVDLQAEFLAMRALGEEIEGLKKRFAPPEPPAPLHRAAPVDWEEARGSNGRDDRPMRASAGSFAS